MRSFTLAIACVGLLAFSLAACGDEAKVGLADVPTAGLAAAKAMFPKAEIVGAAKETEDGKTFFEVTFKEQGRTIDVTVGTQGNIELVEREIGEKELPAAVGKTLAAKYPKAAMKLVERVDNMKDGKLALDFYEVLLVTAGNEKLEVQIAPGGKIKAEEKKQRGDE